jgi:glycine/D-amino acid oxidase-like deaminating enzyme
VTVVSHAISGLSLAALGNSPWEPASPPPRASLPAPGSIIDVLVVGAGLTGLAAALALATSGREVTVVEQAFGGGATSRSGGIVLGETLVGPSPLFDGCEEALRAWIAASGVDCGLAWEGCLELARDATLAAQPIDWQDEGTVRFSTMINGGVLDPARLAAGLAAAACRAGARIVNEASVESVDVASTGLRVTTNRGAISARQMIMATDAMLATPGSATLSGPRAMHALITPWDERGITVAIQTLPIDANALAALGLKPHQAFYTADLPLLWGRVMPDHSLLVGRELLAPTFDAPPNTLSALISAAGVRLLARTRGLHAAVANVDLKRVWGGPVVRTAAGFPHIARDPDIPQMIWAGGYGGHGIAQAFRAGHLAAELVNVRGVRGSSD